MLIKKSETRQKNLWNNCTVWEYEGKSKILSSARSIINGRLPEEWTFRNNECEESYFVISGTGKVYSDKWTFELNEWDVYHFDKWEKYYVKWNNLNLVISNSPKRESKQFKIIDE